MRDALAALFSNLRAGLRVASFRRVDREAFRADVPAWLLLVVFSALLDVALDGLRASSGATFSMAGLDGELYATGLLMVTAAVIAAASRQAAAFVAIPVVALASFPLLQVLHAVPDIAGLQLPDVADLAIDTVVVLWIAVVCMRAVFIVCDGPPRLRIVRAVLGGVLLSAPLWFAPLAGPGDAWWDDGGSEDDTAADLSPASEAVMDAQAYLLDDALDDLEDERPGITDLYFVGFAPDARAAGYRTEVDDVAHALAQHFGTTGRSITLVNNPDTLAEVPFATVTNLRHALTEIGEAIDPEDDVVMLYLTAPDVDDHGLAAVHPPLDLLPLTPQTLKQLLDAASIRYRVIVVSTCAAGEWLDLLADEDTAVLVPAAGDSRPKGCDGGDAPSPFARRVVDDALGDSGSLADGLRRAAANGGALEIGSRIEALLARIGRSAATRTAAVLHGARRRV